MWNVFFNNWVDTNKEEILCFWCLRKQQFITKMIINNQGVESLIFYKMDMVFLLFPRRPFVFCCVLRSSVLLLSKIDLPGLTLCIPLILTSQGRSLTVSLGMRGSTIW